MNFLPSTTVGVTLVFTTGKVHGHEKLGIAKNYSSNLNAVCTTNISKTYIQVSELGLALLQKVYGHKKV